jgi:hypothetical protein
VSRSAAGRAAPCRRDPRCARRCARCARPGAPTPPDRRCRRARRPRPASPPAPPARPVSPAAGRRQARCAPRRGRRQMRVQGLRLAGAGRPRRGEGGAGRQRGRQAASDPVHAPVLRVARRHAQHRRGRQRRRRGPEHHEPRRGQRRRLARRAGRAAARGGGPVRRIVVRREQHRPEAVRRADLGTQPARRRGGRTQATAPLPHCRASSSASSVARQRREPVAPAGWTQPRGKATATGPVRRVAAGAGLR